MYINKFQDDIEKHLIDFKSNKQYLPPTNKKKWLYHDMSDNLFPPIKHGFLQYTYDSGMPLHDFVNHVRSSQMFCINLFYHLIENESSTLLKVLSNYSKKELIRIDSFEFEFSSDSNVLGEWKSDENRPEEYVTATDLFIKFRDNADKVAGFLIEVKFSENDFTSCGGFISKGNSDNTKIVCNDGKLLLNDFKTCYLQGAYGKSKLNRKYLDFFSKSDFIESAFSQKCPFILNHQCIRNHSLLRALITAKKIDYGFFVLVHHDLNDSIVGEWDCYKNILSDSAQKEIVRISAGEFLKESKNENFRNYFKDRYCVG